MRMTEKGKASAKRYLGIAQKEEAISKKRDLLIFLDDSEKKRIGYVGGLFATALEQEAAPIIVSTSLLNTIMAQDTMWIGQFDPNKEEYIGIGGINTKSFKPDRWIVKKINDLLSLLIPVNYLESFNIDKNKVKESGHAIDVISDVELQLGLRVNHMETIDYQSMWSTYRNLKIKVLSYFYKSSEEPIFADYFTNSLNVIFCEKSNYQNKKKDIPEWLIYLGGHGTWINAVADISFDDFKKLLYFFDNKINTKLLVVSSCYAGGVNINKVYGEIKLGTQEYYSFPIIIQALNDVYTSSTAPIIDMRVFDYDRTIKIKYHIDFVNFFKKAKKIEGNYSEIIKPIFENSIQNTPQIKLPGIEWFLVMELDKKIVSIGSTLVKTRDPQKPLDIVSFFKKDPEAILLYTDNIPFELVINSSKMKYIISMVSPQFIQQDQLIQMKDLFTRIKKITSAQSFSDILYWFLPIIFANYTYRYFCIDEIADKKDIIIFRTNDGYMRVYYKDEGDVAFTKKIEIQDIHNISVKQLESELKEIIFEKLDKDSEDNKYYQNFIQKRDEYSELSKEREEIRQEITSEQVGKIENVLAGQREKQKELKEAYTVSEPEVD